MEFRSWNELIDNYLHILVVEKNPTILQEIIKSLAISQAPNTLVEFDEDLLALGLKDEPPEFTIETSSCNEGALVQIKKALHEGKQYAIIFISISESAEDDTGIEIIKKIWDADPEIQVVIFMSYSDLSWDHTVKTLGLRDNYLILKNSFDKIALKQLAHALIRKWLLNKEAKRYSELLQLTVEERTNSLQHSITLLRSTIESSTDGILVTDLNKKVIYFNKKLTQMWNIPEALIETGDEQLILDYMKAQLNQVDASNKIATAFVTDIFLNTKQIVTCKNETIIECFSQPHKINDTVIGRVRSYHDITEQATLEKKLSFQASHDTLTGLPNRILIFDRVMTAIDRAARSKKEFALLFIDLDRFKLVNDSFTHATGDELLRQVAQRLSALVRKEDTFARIGGDEFVMIIPELRKEEYAINIAAKILKSFREPFIFEHHKVDMTTSIGISIYPYDGDNVDDLLKNADLAMYQAKQQGGNQFQFYTKQLNEQTIQRYEMEARLNKALIDKEFFLLYQPQLAFKNTSLLSIEALLRWNHPEKGVITPIDFIRIAEESGLIVPIGEWVIQEVCSQLKAWKKKGLPPITVAINIAIEQLKQTNFISVVKSILKKYQVDPHCLEFDIKESMLMNHSEILPQLNQFQAMGIKIALDDFGNGNLNLCQLKTIKIDRLKIDPSFIRNISFSHSDEVIIKSIIAISQSFNVTVLAEGVENQNQMNFLKKQQCDQMQGYLFSKPLSATTIEQFLQDIIKNDVSL